MGYDTTAWTTAGNTITIGGTTMYADFFTNDTESLSATAGYHEMLTFGNCNYGSYQPHLGNSPDPETSFTTSIGAGQWAAVLIPCLWFLPDDIYIDGVTSLEGGDSSATDTTRMHLMSYDFTSGSASCLTNGALLAYSPDTINAGRVQPYSSIWTISSNSVSSGKVIVATFESDSTNSDYAINVKVKYHLI